MSEFKNGHEKELIARQQEIYSVEGDTRDAFYRDYTRIIHSNAFRRLKHKTQVFFNINNDHICTRMEHVIHVESVSHSIAFGLGLNLELTKAIAYGHDLGHAPFGHEGETVLNKLMKNNLSKEYIKNTYNNEPDYLFWHEKNGLRFVDFVELLPDPNNVYHNLNLTYAVRDGIVSHCGEIDENALKPREEFMNLDLYRKKGEFSPCTWEGCVVKISDKIAYLGRDIEDAITLNMLSITDKQELKRIALEYVSKETLNTTGIMHSLINDICINSSPDMGICLSKNKLELFNEIKKYNYEVIYKNEKFNTYKEYVRFILEKIFYVLLAAYDKQHTLQQLESQYGSLYPKLVESFSEWLGKYCVNSMLEKNDKNIIGKISNTLGSLENEKIYGDLKDKDIYIQSIVDYISGMTDSFAISIFNELLTFS